MLLYFPTYIQESIKNYSKIFSLFYFYSISQIYMHIDKVIIIKILMKAKTSKNSSKY
jgi:hypothetical protein